MQAVGREFDPPILHQMPGIWELARPLTNDGMSRAVGSLKTREHSDWHEHCLIAEVTYAYDRGVYG